MPFVTTHNDRLRYYLMPAITSMVYDLRCLCNLNEAGDLVIKKYDNYTSISLVIPYEVLLLEIMDENYGEIVNKIKSIIMVLTINLKKFDWSWTPEWQKRKDIVFRKFI